MVSMKISSPGTADLAALNDSLEERRVPAAARATVLEAVSLAQGKGVTVMSEVSGDGADILLQPAGASVAVFVRPDRLSLRTDRRRAARTAEEYEFCQIEELSGRGSLGAHRHRRLGDRAARDRGPSADRDCAAGHRRAGREGDHRAHQRRRVAPHPGPRRRNRDDHAGRSQDRERVGPGQAHPRRGRAPPVAPRRRSLRSARCTSCSWSTAPATTATADPGTGRRPNPGPESAPRGSRALPQSRHPCPPRPRGRRSASRPTAKSASTADAVGVHARS